MDELDPTSRLGKIIVGLVGSNQLLFLRNAEFHAWVYQSAHAMADTADLVAKGCRK